MTSEASLHPPVARSGLTAIKGHGTENDFLVIPDLDGELSLSAGLVQALCDRHAGIGADGILRVVRTELATEPDVLSQAPEAEYFMDYRNADGSIVEMCGNGVRVFGRYLRQAGLIDGPVNVATRGGVKGVTFDGDQVTVAMGLATARPERPTVDGRPSLAALDLPNPHVVVELETEDELHALDLTVAPRVEPPLPAGQNVEFFVRRGPDEVVMRVHERGVGETRSCGTGICAVAVAAAGDQAGGAPWQVEVLGGRCTVGWAPDGSVTLAGPAVLVGEVEIGERWLAEHR
ncbi:MAG TPA: diaminopimelate epimerase [Jatrophihabitans sp.]|nr:diaminopimelate epimerase [Jatrophihabitans sp.]